MFKVKYVVLLLNVGLVFCSTPCGNDDSTCESKLTGNFKFTKLLDVGFDEFKYLHPDIQDAVISEMKSLRGDKSESEEVPCVTTTTTEMTTTTEAITENPLANMTLLIEELSEALAKVRLELAEIKENLTAVAETAANPVVPVCNCTYNVQKEDAPVMLKGCIPISCKEAIEMGHTTSGIYEIQPKSASRPFMVNCDMETRGGGWAHLQRRIDGSQDFDLTWREYRCGFGDLNKEFWLGLEHIHHLTGFEGTELLVEIVDKTNTTAYAHYTSFAVGSESEGYPLKVLSGFSGTAGDSLIHALGNKFVTKDLDRAENSNACGKLDQAAFWYNDCYHTNLNGKYVNPALTPQCGAKCMFWDGFGIYSYCHARARMMVRPA